MEYAPLIVTLSLFYVLGGVFCTIKYSATPRRAIGYTIWPLGFFGSVVLFIILLPKYIRNDIGPEGPIIKYPKRRR